MATHIFQNIFFCFQKKKEHDDMFLFVLLPFIHCYLIWTMMYGNIMLYCTLAWQDLQLRQKGVYFFLIYHMHECV